MKRRVHLPIEPQTHPERKGKILQIWDRDGFFLSWHLFDRRCRPFPLVFQVRFTVGRPETASGRDEASLRGHSYKPEAPARGTQARSASEGPSSQARRASEGAKEPPRWRVGLVLELLDGDLAAGV